MRSAAAAVALVAMLAGCGGSKGGRTASGGSVFAQQCSSCHSLVGNESQHKLGGDLLGYRFGRATLTSFTREMPTRHRLSRAELRAVVDYVLRAERSAG